MSCACTIWHPVADANGHECRCDCHGPELTPDEIADLAILAARRASSVDQLQREPAYSGGYAADLAPMMAITHRAGPSGYERVERVIPWHVAISLEVA